jgi:hypothetical protein
MKSISTFFSSLFKTKQVARPSATQLSLNREGWTAIADGPPNACWINDQGDELTISFDPQRPSLEFDPRDVEAGRNFFRDVTSEIGQGFIELTHVVLDGVDVTKYIVKLRQNPAGVAYIGELVVPFEECNWNIHVLSKEFPPTGMRESIVVSELLQQGVIKPDVASGRMVGWGRDPYDPQRITPDFSYNLADDAQYDPRFPLHPLSRLRRVLGEIESTLRIDRTSCPLSSYRHAS